MQLNPRLAVCLQVGVVCCCALVQAEPRALPAVSAESVGMDAEKLRQIDDAVAAALKEERMPGCVVTVGRRGCIVFQKAYGNRQVEPEREAMTVDTVFDLASLTKPIATATSVMLLAEREQIDLDEPAAKYLPEFTGRGKQRITVRHLLLHTSGLTADNALGDYTDGPEKAWERICGLKLLSAPGERFRYSDVGFIVLGKLVERVSKKPLNEFADENIFAPLGMKETGFLPPKNLRLRAAPTQRREDRWMRGEVHDPRAWELGGVAGHAGLFSTADDLARYAQMMAEQGRLDETQILSRKMHSLMTSGKNVSGGLRGFGWDVQTGYSSNRGQGWSAGAFGHGGFTGTAMWIDPELEMFVIFLSNRVHPAGKGSVNRLAGEIGTIAADAIAADAIEQRPPMEGHGDSR